VEKDKMIIEKIKKGEQINLYEFDTYNLASFKYYSDINRINLITDADKYGGDTFAELRYNMENDAGITLKLNY
jgi:hypothetical protein